jgi:3-phosphoshikimate 1-carboxyvinyltransferase
VADLTLYAGRLSGLFHAPPSKSIMHRTILLSALAGQPAAPPEGCGDDVLATWDCIQVLHDPVPNYDCRESATTLRLLIPLSMALSGGGLFYRAEGLARRPIDVYPPLFPHATFSGNHPLRVSGWLKAGRYALPGDISSQFISGLLLSLPLLDGDSEIHAAPPIESSGYIRLTLNVMEAYGVSVQTLTPYDFLIPGGQRYRCGSIPAEGDYSQSAVFLAAAALGHPVVAEGLHPVTAQGDAQMLDILRRMGARPVFHDGKLMISASGRLNAADIDASQCPDIVPITALLLCLSQGRSIIRNAGRLRLKECDRLQATVQTLGALGADIREEDDSILIRGTDTLRGGVTLSCRNDHRIAMMLSIAALHTRLPVTLTGVECVSKSWPDFFDCYVSLGGRYA